ncbi:MAG: putative ATPase related to phosphate starvation-inducible protein PhoH [Firmicutes bacterium]|nr:putative ATPase related to phosphate starvation-inducible protein PhoH [Bacillota bacterium]
MQAIIQHIHTEVSKIKTLLNGLKEYSDLIRWNHSRIKISGLGDYQWDKLNAAGRDIQEQLLKAYNRLSEQIGFLATRLPSEQQRALEAASAKIVAVITQTGNSFSMDKEELFDNAVRALDLQLQIVSAAYEILDSQCLIIPDIAALVANPEIEEWKFEGIESFKLLLLPTIVNELDENTTNTMQVKNKIKNKILEYAKQGNIAVGVNINGNNVIKFAGNIKEIKETLPELDVHNQLDQLLAAYFEFVRTNPHSQVLLITNNPALQERARVAKVSYLTAPALPAANPSVAVQAADKPPEVKQAQVTPNPADSSNVARPTRTRSQRNRAADKLAANKLVENKAAENKAVAAKPTKIKPADNRPDTTAIKISMPPAIPQSSKVKAPKIKSDLFKSDAKPLIPKPKR